MDIPTINDRDFGRGRQYDSSSSRESSPRRPPKRSFSPNSDEDDNLKQIIVEDNDTPPPADRSFLRQPLAFQPSGTLTVSTYEAQPPPKKVGRPKNNPFMRIDDGKEGGPIYASGSKSTRGTKKRRVHDYRAQTNRFRVEKPSKRDKATGSTVNTSYILPTPQASEPYHQSTFLVDVSPTPTLSSSYTTANSPSPQSASTLPPALQPTPPPPPPPRSLPPNHQSKQRDGPPADTFASPPRQHGFRASPPVLTPPPHMRPERRGSPTYQRTPPPQNSGSYYRRDYDRELEVRARQAAALRERDNFREQSIRASSIKPNSTQPRPGKPQSLNSGQKRMVTILIEDRRYERVDEQLTEVKIPLRPMDNPEEGFWADAQLLSQQLQAGPSRIDGPARVYTFRGKYRQIFLRVSADNQDEFMTMNIIVAPNRTINCFIEELPVPGEAPAASYKPPHVRMSSSPESTSSRESSPSPPAASYRAEQRKKFYGEPRVSELALIHGPPGGKAAESHLQHKEPQIGAASSPYSADESEPPSDEEEKSPEDLMEDRLVEEVEKYISEDPEWISFFQAKGHKLPHRVCDTMVQFKFVKKCWDKLVGTTLRSNSLMIKKEHILRALHVNDPEFLRICTDTMGLLELYGLNGKRGVDERVLQMLHDTSEPAYGSKPIKKLLHWMQDLDKAWNTKHSSSV